MYAGLILLAAFVLWTAVVCIVDVEAIGPMETKVGFASLNEMIHRRIGVHMTLYAITDALSLFPLGLVVGFALLGLGQWIKRGNLMRVDRDILALGVLYAVVAALFVLFEIVVINYRPILIDGCAEASYLSSTTLLVLCVMPTAILQLRARMRYGRAREWITWLLAVFTVFMTVGRFLSGVHWFSDIVGGTLLSTGVVMLYLYASAPGNG